MNAIASQILEWHLEIRRSSDGLCESTDTFVGTEQEAMEDAREWLEEALTIDDYQLEILVINKETEECIYQGTFDMFPNKKGVKMRKFRVTVSHFKFESATFVIRARNFVEARESFRRQHSQFDMDVYSISIEADDD